VLDNTGQIARRGGGELREKRDEEETCRDGWRGEEAGLPGRQEEKPARSSSNCRDELNTPKIVWMLLLDFCCLSRVATLSSFCPLLIYSIRPLLSFL
jgi:hypothetical protein